MDELLDEIGLSPDDLYKLHTGHHILKDSDDSDSSVESESLDEDLRPPPYTQDEINQNLVVIEASVHTENPEDDINSGTAEEIVKMLLLYITNRYCFICMKNAAGHYTSPNHYNNVRCWLKQQLPNNLMEVNFSNFFYEICKSALSGNDLVQTHVASNYNKSKAKSFCLPCFRPIPESSMSDHLQSKKHGTRVPQNSLFLLDSNFAPPLDAQKNDNRNHVSNTTNERSADDQQNSIEELDTKCEQLQDGQQQPLDFTYSTVLDIGSFENLHIGSVDSANEDINKHTIDIAGYGSTAIKLIELMTVSYCFLCNKALPENKANTHYSKRSHIKKLRAKVDYAKRTCGLDLIPEKYLFCEACNEIFLNPKLAEQHYNTSKHKKISFNYCNICMVHDHPNSHPRVKKHKRRHRLYQLSLSSKQDAESGNRSIDKEGIGLKTTDSEDKEQGHLFDLTNHIHISDEESEVTLPAADHPGGIITEKLRDMLSATFCYICQRNVNMHMLNHHYLERGHTIKLRKWLDNEIKISGVKIDQKVLYCEDCSLELDGTDEGLKHYESISHQLNTNTYCSVCIFRGTPSATAEHISTQQHKEKTKKLSGSTKSENTNPTSWPRKLTKLITLRECNLCNVTLLTVEKADFHYCSESHNTKVENWLDNYHRFGSSAVDIASENNKKFCCTFCLSSFTSDQELDDHKNSHFPSLGSTSSRRSRHSLRSRLRAERFHVEKSKQMSSNEVIVDEPTSTSPAQPDFSENEEKNMRFNKIDIKQETPTIEQPIKDSRNEENTKLNNNIIIEMNKLINALYFSKTLPFDQSLVYLKRLNKILMDARSNNKGPKVLGEHIAAPETRNTGASGNNIFNSSRTKKIADSFLYRVPNNVTETSEQCYAKFRLSIEMQRLKIALSDELKVSTDLALMYVKNLNEVLKVSINSGSSTFDVDSIFDTDDSTIARVSSGENARSNLENKLEYLDKTLLNARKMSAEVALDFITRFNVRLENLLKCPEDGYLCDELNDDDNAFSDDLDNFT